MGSPGMMEQEKSVITSYSIHYTKLYEVQIWADCHEFEQRHEKRLWRQVGHFIALSPTLHYNAPIHTIGVFHGDRNRVSSG